MNFSTLLQKKMLFRGLFLALMLGACAYFIQRPRTFWDMLPYMGAVVELDHADSAYVHRTTYEAFKAHASEKMQAAMIGGHPFCRAVAGRADLFQQQLPFFRVKLLYVHFSRVFYLSGIPLFYAVLLPSLFAFVLTGIFVFRWLENYFSPGFAFVLSGALLACEFNLQAFRVASPDALAGFFILLTSYYLLEKKRTWPAVLFLIPAVLARPDNVLFAAALLGGLALVQFKADRKMAYACLLLLAATGGLALLLSRLSGYETYTMFYRAFVELPVNPLELNVQFDWDTYLGGVKKGLGLSARVAGMYLLVFGGVLLVYLRRIKLRSFEGIWLGALLLSMLGRIVLHPIYENRYMFAHLLVILMLLLIEAGKRFSTRIPARIQNSIFNIQDRAA